MGEKSHVTRLVINAKRERLARCSFAGRGLSLVEVSVLMPCLNEAGDARDLHQEGQVGVPRAQNRRRGGDRG